MATTSSKGGTDAGANGSQPGAERVPDEPGMGNGEVLKQSLADDAGLDEDVVRIIASGPRGPDRPTLRRAQALVGSGVMPEASVAITREILRVKLEGQAEVAKLMGSADASTVINKLAAAIVRETNGSKVLSVEVRAASIHWKLRDDVPVRFARRNPQRLGNNGRWRPVGPISGLHSAHEPRC